MNICDLNLLNICRACLEQQNEMLDLLGSDEKCENLIKMYAHLSDFEIDKTTEMAFFMCKICEDKLAIAYNFQEQCKKSNDIIQSYLLTNGDKNQMDNIEADIETGVDNQEIIDVEYNTDLKSNENDPIKVTKHGRRLRQFSSEKVSSALEEKKRVFYENTECVKCGFIGTNVRALSTHMTMLHKALKKKWCPHCNILVENLREHTKDHKNDVLKCQLCDKIFSSKGHITEHLRSHSNQRPYECDICNKTFNNKRILKVHTRIHTNERPYKCMHCSKAYTQYTSLKIHMKQHSDEEKHFCHTCNTEFNIKTEFDGHKCELARNNENNDCFPTDNNVENEVVVQNCEYVLQNNFAHQNGSENIEIEARFEFESVITSNLLTQGDAQNENIVFCIRSAATGDGDDIPNDLLLSKQNGSAEMHNAIIQNCSIFTQNEEAGENQLGSVMPLCNVDQEIIIKNEFTELENVELKTKSDNTISLNLENMPYTKRLGGKSKKKIRMYAMRNFCEICNKKVRSLTDHNKEFHDDNNLNGNGGKSAFLDLNLCTVCGKQFKTVSKLTIHMRIHTGESPYKCRYCDKRMMTRNHLLVHERTHTGEKPHICHVCGKGFAQSSVLNTHMRLHTGRPEQCNICEQRFCRSSELRLHLRKHTGEKPYKCQECSQSFIQSSHLKEHMNIHSEDRPYKCKYCEKGFKQSSSLKSHVQIHLGYKPYRCSQCPYSCRQNYSLTQHMKQHVADAPRPDRPHICSLCARGFTTLAMLQSHASTSHANSAFVF